MAQEVRSGFVEVDGGRLFYEAAGSGPAVVLVHGGMWDRRMWDDQFVEFAQQHRVVRYDVRGFGRSDSPTAPYRNHEELHALLRALGIERVTPVGLSMGGSIVLDFAVEHPEATAALVVASCGIGGHSDWSEEVRGAWDREEAAVQAGEPAAALQGQLDFWTPAGDDPDVDRRLREIAFDNLEIYDIPDGISERAEPPVIGRLSAIGVPPSWWWASGTSPTSTGWPTG
jgi:pimeloyl-ACP methyl ester carboxylesterase